VWLNGPFDVSFARSPPTLTPNPNRSLPQTLPSLTKPNFPSLQIPMLLGRPFLQAAAQRQAHKSLTSLPTISTSVHLSSTLTTSAPPPRLFFSTSSTSNIFDVDKFTKDFLAEVKNVPKATDPSQSSAALRSLVKSKQLLFTDMKNNPEKFFLAHRLLSSVGLGGFGIRFTVQFNLFAGSMVGLAGPEQLKMLDDIQEKGQLGCFLLTEKQAGVLSGLIVETTCVSSPNYPTSHFFIYPFI